MPERSTDETLSIVAFAGSLRRGSYNRALLRAAIALAPPELRIDIVEIRDLPFYDSDVESQGDPPAVHDFKERLRSAGGLLIATPEYNDGIPGVLTNALDWASRLPGRSPLSHKPVALVGASMSQVGTARGQMYLRQILGHSNARVLPPPELLVARAQEKFDAQLHLEDEGTRNVLALLLQRFARWILRERAALAAEATMPPLMATTASVAQPPSPESRRRVAPA